MMNAFFITLFLTLIFGGYFLYKRQMLINKFDKEIKKEYKKLINALNKIESEIHLHKDTEYYEYMLNNYSNLSKFKILPSEKSEKTLVTVHNKYRQLDNIFVNLKRDIRTIDKFEFIKNNINSYKSKYRYLDAKRQKKYLDLSEKYINLGQYLNVSMDFEDINRGEIKELMSIYKEGLVNHRMYKLHDLKRNVLAFEVIHSNLVYKLNELDRIEYRLNDTEKSIKELEKHIENNDNTLYKNCLNRVRNTKVDNDVIETWNYIKKLINKYHKEKLLNNNLFNSHQSLLDIVAEMKELNLYFETVN